MFWFYSLSWDGDSGSAAADCRCVHLGLSGCKGARRTRLAVGADYLDFIAVAGWSGLSDCPQGGSADPAAFAGGCWKGIPHYCSHCGKQFPFCEPGSGYGGGPDARAPKSRKKRNRRYLALTAASAVMMVLSLVGMIFSLPSIRRAGSRSGTAAG